MILPFIFPIILFLLSTVTHLLFYGWPAQVVFDEVYNGKFVTAYATGQYYFDVHPPLARILTKFYADILNIPYNVDWSIIGNTISDSVINLRLLPILAGIMLPVIIYFICRHVSFSKSAAFTTGLLIILENSLLVQTRFILFDGLMITSGFLAILLYLIYVKQGKWWFLYASALCAAVAFSIKWTGGSFLLFIFLTEIIRNRKIKHISLFVFQYVCIGLFVYLLVFAFHFAYLTNSGTGDVFMTDRFQKTLSGNEYEKSDIEPKKFFGKTIELNIKMLEANGSLSSSHPYSSMWYTWPIMQRSIFYWEGKANEEGNSYIYLLGNPFIYWFGTLALFILAWQFVIKKNRDKALLFILLGYILNFVPFIFIGRIMFIYHYQAALIFSILAVGYIVDRLLPPNVRVNAILGLLALCLASFIYFSPLTYGTNLSDEELKARMWLSTWR